MNDLDCELRDILYLMDSAGHAIQDDGNISFVMWYNNARGLTTDSPSPNNVEGAD